MTAYSEAYETIDFSIVSFFVIFMIFKQKKQWGIRKRKRRFKTHPRANQSANQKANLKTDLKTDQENQMYHQTNNQKGIYMTAFQIFMEKIRKGVSEYCGETCVVELSEIRKNNGIVYHGITVTAEDVNISPTLYVDDLYREYTEGKTLGQIMEQVIARYEKHKVKGNIDLHFLMDFSWVKEHILYKLVGYEENREFLQEVPHIRYLDMALVFYCSILNDAFGSATVLVKNGFCRLWDVEAKDLLLLAEKNTPRILPEEILDMRKMLGQISDIGKPEPELEEVPCRMYVLTNKQKQFGAVAILYPEVLKQFAEKMNSNLILLPSSVHEVILVPERDRCEIHTFQEMVREINRTQVDWEEVLTDSVYYYDRVKNQVTQR